MLFSFNIFTSRRLKPAACLEKPTNSHGKGRLAAGPFLAVRLQRVMLKFAAWITENPKNSTFSESKRDKKIPRQGRRCHRILVTVFVTGTVTGLTETCGDLGNLIRILPCFQIFVESPKPWILKASKKIKWCALEDSNLWPLPRQGSALPLS